MKASKLQPRSDDERTLDGHHRCPRCGQPLQGTTARLLDPHGRWSVCVRCGFSLDQETNDDR